MILCDTVGGRMGGEAERGKEERKEKDGMWRVGAVKKGERKGRKRRGGR